jgi:predicted negative regulator of RcsB-dependent stress response
MRVILLVGWLLAAIGAAAWHYGPGQDYLKRDDAARAREEANHQATASNWGEAIAKYDEALKSLPIERIADARAIRLQRAKAQMMARKLPDAHADLRGIVDEMKDDPKADEKVLADARSTLANAQYYITWLMRLEGQPRDAWEPEIEAARQTYRLLAERSEAQGDAVNAKRHKEDLESAIRLERMDLGELQGLPLPSQ